eukprot:GFYU01021251.1.p1 GENE.GFYU01021251.1~~GFYU01021251.1.p1  ORF type:complete len:171 (-),score=43.03 GFYU01021251.1:390-902(-)
MAMMVELANVLLNQQWWMETTGHANRPIFDWVVFANYASWIIFRVINPVYLIVLLWTVVIPEFGSCGCAVVSYFTGHGLTLFCIVVWIAVLSPEFTKRLRKRLSGEPLSPEQPGARDLTPAVSVEGGTTKGTKEMDLVGPATLDSTSADGDAAARVIRRKSSTAAMIHAG